MQEVFTDMVHVSCSEHDATLTLGLMGVLPGEPSQMHTRLRMSHVTAKVVALLLLRVMREYEGKVGKIPVSAEALKAVGIAQEDW